MYSYKDFPKNETHPNISFETVEKQLAMAMAVSQQSLRNTEKAIKIMSAQVEKQEAEKAKSGCFFWRKNKVAAVPQSINERALTLSFAK